MSSNLSTRTIKFAEFGFEKDSPLSTFAQFYILSKSEISNPKSEILLWVVAQMAEHRTVTAAIEGSSPFDHPSMLISDAIAIGGRRNA